MRVGRTSFYDSAIPRATFHRTVGPGSARVPADLSSRRALLGHSSRRSTEIHEEGEGPR